MSWALFKDGEQILKPHTTRWAALMEAYEAHAVVGWTADFPGDDSGAGLLDGYEIKEVNT